jgi:hypothetical protein
VQLQPGNDLAHRDGQPRIVEHEANKLMVAVEASRGDGLVT